MEFFSKVGRQVEQLKQKAMAVTSGKTDDSERNTSSLSQETGQEPEPSANQDVDADPRVTANEDRNDIDTSDAAVADESGEAVNPDSEQAEPVQTEGTEPEFTPDEDSSHREKESDTRNTTNNAEKG
jgi:hypothetical protein